MDKLAFKEKKAWATCENAYQTNQKGNLIFCVTGRSVQVVYSSRSEALPWWSRRKRRHWSRRDWEYHGMIILPTRDVSCSMKSQCETLLWENAFNVGLLCRIIGLAVPECSCNLACSTGVLQWKFVGSLLVWKNVESWADEWNMVGRGWARERKRKTTPWSLSLPPSPLDAFFAHSNSLPVYSSKMAVEHAANYSALARP